MYIYDKSGNLKEVSLPINAKGKTIKPTNKTHCGSLLGGVGFSMIPNKRKKNLRTIASANIR